MALEIILGQRRVILFLMTQDNMRDKRLSFHHENIGTVEFPLKLGEPFTLFFFTQDWL